MSSTNQNLNLKMKGHTEDTRGVDENKICLKIVFIIRTRVKKSHLLPPCFLKGEGAEMGKQEFLDL